MYSTCPKCGHQRQANEQANPDACPACGLVFAKWLKSSLANAAPVSMESVSPARNTNTLVSLLVSSLFYTEDKINPVVFWSRALLFIGLLAWSWKFLQMDFVLNPFAIGRTFMHNIDLIFHEAGHILFMPFGRFMTILGGSLFQVLMPLIVMFTFLLKSRNPFAASVGLWWAGQSLMDLAPYIDDAIDQKLVLLGGRTGADAPGNHDWGNLLIELDMLEKHRQIASTVDNSGRLLILLALAWGGYMLFLQIRKLG